MRNAKNLTAMDVFIGSIEMDDLISRQTAVDACLKYNGVGWVWSQILDELKEIPSAVVRCADCYHYNEEYGQCLLNNSDFKPTDYCSYGSK